MSITIDKLLTVDETGMPKVPTIAQIQDKDVLALYSRDMTRDKLRYISEAGVIYYLGDPQSPAHQQGLSRNESLKLAIENYNLPKDYVPDALVNRLIDKYYNSCIGEAGRTIENLLKSIHLINIANTKMTELLNEKLKGALSLEDITTINTHIDATSKRIKEIPELTAALKVAYDNLRDEKEQQLGRGKQEITSSMDANDY